jgi:hypothetical protein
MAGRYRNRSIKPGPTFGERAARSAGEYMPEGSPEEIPFSVSVNGTLYSGILSPNLRRLPCRLPGSFLVYKDGNFQSVISWKLKGWSMDGDPDLVEEIGNYITVWYG